MKSNEEKAIETFQSGFNCAQSVVSVYTETLYFDPQLALSLSCGFGGGMGRLQETCGALTGAFMVLGIYNCKKYTNNIDRKNATYSMIQRFSNEFKTTHGATDCKTLLLNCDLKTEEGQRFHKETHQSEEICQKCIATSIQLLDKMMEE